MNESGFIWIILSYEVIENSLQCPLQATPFSQSTVQNPKLLNVQCYATERQTLTF